MRRWFLALVVGSVAYAAPAFAQFRYDAEMRAYETTGDYRGYVRRDSLGGTRLYDRSSSYRGYARQDSLGGVRVYGKNGSYQGYVRRPGR